jgi:hypothetical protein
LIEKLWWSCDICLIVEKNYLLKLSLKFTP